MEGPDIADEETKGLIPRMFDRIFQKISDAEEEMEFTVKVSYLEIYMERIMDLLDPKKTNLLVRRDPQRGIFIKDCTEVYVNSCLEMFDVMRAGGKNRSIAATRMNERSSRSHSIFICTILQKNTKTDTSCMGKLYCVDLAGSEKTGKTNVSG